MSTQAVRSTDPNNQTGLAVLDMKLEVAILPVSNVERAKEFYLKLGWRLDATPPWVVQITPHGSACSIQFGKNLTPAPPGSAASYLVVSNIVEAREKLIAAGIEVGDFVHLGAGGIEPGLDPERRTYFSRAVFHDPDGNTWILQEITSRLPGRVDSGVTSYGSVTDLVAALKRAEAAHSEHEKRTGAADANWADWYAAYMAAEQTGAELPK